ncbi:single-stranded-DNA-specific exonuclease RecJ [Litorilituus sediminis]|uniref:Single-stranded-DNA-specific exonuclease RecJ n=1 Tax=Litorilituus sediminis TaxID=718192 RepID=A0A4P6P698_9GAMM|nr:single-stranded-DNA-specific exonuclease RecJ [Litorilituus sediminis]QBG37121.1 single-stranded-DNA-specific exonuclease RecJ [Litorilituus sediminis]
MNKQIIRRERVSDEHLPAHLHPVIKQIYATRGVRSDVELELVVANLLGVKELDSCLKGLKQACVLLHQALVNKAAIVIVGDFDADGATSTALMMEALTLMGSNHHSFIVPNRFEYGYGLTPEIVDIAHGQGAQMLITVDNGISCIAGVARAKALGMQVIVTDHHLPGQQTPDADAIVNPNQHGCSFASKALAGVGVAFYLMMALRKTLREADYFQQNFLAEPNIAQLLDLVALGTVADVVPLDVNNRILVSQGLNRIRAGQTRPGIVALIEIANRNQQQLVASDFGFALGPRINAAGRLDDMSYGINCLLAGDLSSARVMAAELDDLNKARREIEQGMQAEAERVMASLNFSSDNLPSAIALYQQDWHQGVIGIVAGRLKEKYHRPSIVFANGSDDNLDGNDDIVIKGSARSIPGLHIRDLLERIDSLHPELIDKFGGHAMAAGLSIKVKHFTQFQQVFAELAANTLKEEDLQQVLVSDGELAAQDMTLDFAQLIRDAGPWGQAFVEPLFDDVFSLVQQRIVGEKHLKLVVEKSGQVFDAIAFNVDVNAWPNSSAQQVKLVYRLDINEFRGKRNVQLMVEYLQAV